MPVDPRSFWHSNMADTCSVWNVLSSSCLYQSAVSAGCTFSCTDFVIYECLHKPRQGIYEGELSSIAFAKRTSQAFLTDDRGAFRLAREIMVAGHVQSTPHLFSWMIYERILHDSDKETIIKEHESVKGQLRQKFEESYAVALQYMG